MTQLFEQLRETHPNKKFIFMLDSVDQLNPVDYSLEWVPTNFKNNIKIIFSSIPGHGDLLNRFKKEVGLDEKNLIQISMLDTSLAKMILEDLLNKEKRILSSTQWETIDRLLGRANRLPLFVTLVFEIVSKWPSFHQPDLEFSKCTDIDKCIQYLFKYLETVHGELLFKRAIVYMSLFKNGISENEIEDILSLDDDVLYDVFEFHAPPVRKLPVALWSRIKHDLKAYMVEKEVHDTRVIYWYHRRFIEVANSFYISKLNSTERTLILSNVVDFFNETWKKKPKPFKYNEFIAKKEKLNTNDAAEIRDTSVQPTTFVDSNGNVKYNLRKLNELPAFIKQLTSNLALVLACEHIFFNYEFLLGLFMHCDMREIIDILNNLTSSSSYNISEEAAAADFELNVFNLILLQCGVAAKSHPKSALLQMLSRCLNFYGVSKYMTKLIDEYDRQVSNENTLILSYQHLDAPQGSGLIFQMDSHAMPITHTILGMDSLIFSLSNKLHLFNIELVKEMGETQLSENELFNDLIVYLDNNNDDVDIKKAPLKSHLGFFVVHTKFECKVYAYDGTLLFHKTFESEILAIILLSPKHLLVSFKNANHFDIYNVFTAKLYLSLNFVANIEQIFSNTNKKYINERKHYDNDFIFLVLVFETNNIECFQINPVKDYEINLEKTLCLPSSGHAVSSLNFNKEKNHYFYFDSITICYTNGFISYLKYSSEFKRSNKVESIKPILNDHHDKPVYFKALSQSSHFSNLFLGSDHHLYYMIKDKEMHFFEIEGDFENGIIITPTKIAGMKNGVISFFIINQTAEKDKESKNFVYLKIAELDAHFDDVTSCFIFDQLLLTTSRDSTIKMFSFIKLHDTENTKFNVDRSEKQIKSIHFLNENHALTKSEDSK
jgi:hypothetical protein